MITIILPCYNSSRTIERAIKSTIKQTYQNFELIVIDDGSTDSEQTKIIIHKFNDERIILISHKTNKNGASARNTGIKEAKGEYIAFLDADDEWLPQHLEKSLAAIKEKSCDLIYSKCLVKTSNFPDIVMPQYPIKKNEKVGNYLFCNNGYIATPSIFVKTSCAKKILFNEKLIRHQDYDFLLRYENAKGTITMLNYTGTIVHWENNNIEKKGGTWEYSLNWAIEYKKYLSIHAYSCFVFKNVILQLLKKKRRQKAIKILRKHIRIKYLSKKDIYFLISYFCFSKLIIPRWKIIK